MWAISDGVGLARSEFVLDIEAVRRGCVKLFSELAPPATKGSDHVEMDDTCTTFISQMACIFFS